MASTVDNVGEYKTFMPEAIFLPQDAQQAVVQYKDTPGTDDGKCALVFTDILGSTSLWEMCHEGMRLGLQVHNATIRTLIAAHNGYEVKTIGDAFMVSFATLDKAILFGIEVQEALSVAEWPAELLETPACAKDASGEWAGIRIRIGVNYGEVTVERNETTGRVDYFGPLVNRAARLESACIAGSVCIMDETLSHMAASTSTRLEQIKMGGVTLKGIDQPINVTALLPKSMPNRLEKVKAESSKRQSKKGKEGDKDNREKASSNSSASTVRTKKLNVTTGRFVGDLLKFVEAATVGVVSVMKIREVSTLSATEDANFSLTRIITSLERTEGKLQTVLGSSASVGWNVVKSASSHVEASFRFAGMLLKTFGQELRLGVCTGKVATGYVGNSGHRYVITAGSPSENSARLYAATERYGASTLYLAGERSVQELLTQNGFLRPVMPASVFEVNAAGADACEMHVSRLQRWCGSKFTSLFEKAEEDDEWTDGVHSAEAWSASYLAAFAAQDVTALEGIAKTDKVTERVMFECHATRLRESWQAQHG